MAGTIILPRTLFLALVIFFAASAPAQVPMTFFVPQTKAYGIYYPKSYTVKEKEHIATLTDPNGGGDITISSYSNKNKIEEKDIRELLKEEITHVKPESWNAYKTKFDNLLEGRGETKDEYWIWWAISSGKRLVMISLNKGSKITEEDIRQLRFMIDKLEIYE